MMLRKLAVSLAIAGVLGTSNAHALGLGEIKINSALNQPLDAEIQLLEANKLNPLQIQPRMADIDEYVLAGVEKSSFLSNVNFRVILAPDGSGRIRLTSKDPVQEPFLNFLVEVNWPNGRLVREYTLLLDPPVYDPSKLRATQQPVETVAVSQAAPAPAVVSAPVKNIRTEADPVKQVFVDVHDSLWSIADAHRPNPSITKSQMAIALLKKNPHAFFENNINRMKAGVVLTLPSLEEVSALTPQQAAAEVQRQHAIWKSGVAPVAAEPAKPLVATVTRKPAGQPAAEAEPQAVAPAKPVVAGPDAEDAKSQTTQDADAGVQGAADADAVVNDEEAQALEAARLQLEQQLSATQEELGSLQGENEELNARLADLQAQLDQVQQTIGAKDRNIEVLRGQLNDQQSRLAEAEKGPLDKVLADPTLLAAIGGGLVAVLLGVLAVVGLRRRKRSKQDAETELQGSDNLAAAAVAGGAAAVAVDAMADEEDAAASEADEVVAEAEEPAAELSAEAEDISAVTVDDDLGDLSDLDLDMDLDLDLDLDSDSSSSQVEEDASGSDDILDTEFDLGLADTVDPEQDDADASDDLDALLGTDLDDASLDLGDEDDGLEFNTSSTAEPDDLDDILGGGVDLSDDDLELDVFAEAPAAEAQGEVADDSVAFVSDDDGDDLDFNLSELGLDDVEEPTSEGEESIDDDLEALLQASSNAGGDDDLDFSFDVDADEAELDEASVETAEDVSEEITDDLESLLQESVAEAEVSEAEDDLDFNFDLDADADSALVEEDAVDDDLEALLAGGESAEPVDEDDLDALLAAVDSELEASGVQVDGEVSVEPEEEDAFELPDAEDDDVDALLAALDEGDDVQAASDTSEELERLLSDSEVLSNVQDDDAFPELLLDGEEAQEEENAVAEQEDDALTVDGLDELDLDLGGDDLDMLLEEVEPEAVAEPEAEAEPVADTFALDDDLEALLQEEGDDSVATAEAEADQSLDSDLEALLASDLAGDVEEDDSLLDEVALGAAAAGAVAAGAALSGSDKAESATLTPDEELSANIAHDLDAELDSELQALLEGGADEIELEEVSADEEDLGDVDGWALLEGADEVETKLDLARAYIDMEDADGARDILKEVLAEGSEVQKQEANGLLESLDKS